MHIPENLQRAFTVEYDSIKNVLITTVAIGHPVNASNQIPERSRKANAIWDTGATNTVITSKLVTELGLFPYGKAKWFTVNGTYITNVYYVSIILPNDIIYQIVPVTESPQLSDGDVDILIGMDIISSGDFSITNFVGKTIFSFRYPSCEPVDYVKIINDRLQRNSPPLCGRPKSNYTPPKRKENKRK